MRILLTLVALTQWGELLALEYAAVTFQQILPANLKVANKSLDFVNKVRQDLRRNNDDYAQRDIEGLSQLELPSVPAHPAPRHPNRKRYLAAHPLPPSGLPQRYYVDTRKGKGDVAQGDVTQSDMTQGDMNQGEVHLTTAFRIYTRARPVQNSLRIRKLKKTLSRDKNKLRAQDEGVVRGTEMAIDLVMEDTTSSTLPSFEPIPPTPAPPPPPQPPRPHRKHTPRPALHDSALSEEPARQAPPRTFPLSEQQPARQDPPRDSPLSEEPARQVPPRDSPLLDKPARQAPPRAYPLLEKPARRPPPRDSPLLEKPARQPPPRYSPLLKKPARQAPPRNSPFLEKPERQAPPRKSSLLEKAVYQARPRNAGGALRQVLRSTERNPAPQPDQIDMAHARNPILARIRMKGRLCQRSLMNIEGPVYDTEGKQVMPAHHPAFAHGRLFHETLAPELVLPKCCNCCKKSVLGCQ